MTAPEGGARGMPTACPDPSRPIRERAAAARGRTDGEPRRVPSPPCPPVATTAGSRVRGRHHGDRVRQRRPTDRTSLPRFKPSEKARQRGGPDMDGPSGPGPSRLGRTSGGASGIQSFSDTRWRGIANNRSGPGDRAPSMARAPRPLPRHTERKIWMRPVNTTVPLPFGGAVQPARAGASGVTVPDGPTRTGQEPRFP